MSDTALSVTSAQRRAAIEALGLDPDLTVSVTISPEGVHATLVALDESDNPVILDGIMRTTPLTIPITQEASDD